MQLNEAAMQQLTERGYAIVPQWLAAQTVGHVNQLFSELEFVPAKVGKGENLQERPEIRGDSTYWINPLVAPFKILSTLEALENLRLSCNRELFLGVRDSEFHLARYPAGAFYRKHNDRHETSSQRVLSVIVYLNDNWQPSDGGELVIYNPAHQEIERVLPLGGTMVCFLSADFPHEVLPSQRERRSLTGWFLTGGSNVLPL